MSAPGGAVIALALALGLALGGCAANESTDSLTGQGGSAALAGTLNGGGASSQTAAQEAWRAGFEDANPAVIVNYDPTGSGAGREAFAAGGLAFAGTDAPFSLEAIRQAEFASCAPGSGLVELPAYVSPIAVAFNLDGIDSLNLDAATIARVFSGEIARWDHPAITGQNAGLGHRLPSLPITPVHRSDKSGTTQNFTDYLAAASGGAWTRGAAEEWPAGLAGEAADKTQGVRETLATTAGAIGYLDASQAGGLGTVALRVGGQYTAYSPEGAALAVGRAEMEPDRSPGDIVVRLDRAISQAGAYPLVLVSYLVACVRHVDPAAGALAKAYLAYAASTEGQAAAAANAGSVRLTDDPALGPALARAIEAMR
jgi:phosphate transport system substrate-binding protein